MEDMDVPMNARSRLALRRVTALLHCRPLPEELLICALDLEDKPMTYKQRKVSAQLSLQQREKNSMTVQRKAGIHRWLLSLQEELQQQTGSGSLSRTEVGTSFGPGYLFGELDNE